MEQTLRSFVLLLAPSQEHMFERKLIKHRGSDKVSFHNHILLNFCEYGLFQIPKVIIQFAPFLCLFFLLAQLTCSCFWTLDTHCTIRIHIIPPFFQFTLQISSNTLPRWTWSTCTRSQGTTWSPWASTSLSSISVSSKIFVFEVFKLYIAREALSYIFMSFVNFEIGENSKVEGSFQPVQVVFPQDWTMILILILCSKLFSIQIGHPCWYWCHCSYKGLLGGVHLLKVEKLIKILIFNWTCQHDKNTAISSKLSLMLALHSQASE